MSQPLGNLNTLRTPTPLWVTMRNNQRAAYAFAGSFVRFLTEGYGLDAFRVVYDTEDYQRAYERSLAELEQEWRSVVAGAATVG